MSLFTFEKNQVKKYHQIVFNDYMYNLFNHIKGKPYAWYYEPYGDDEHLKSIVKYYSGKSVNIEDFEKRKRFIKHPPETAYNNYADISTEESNIFFTIEDIGEQSEMYKCRRCGFNMARGLQFWGKAYNTGLNGQKPVDYHGVTKTYYYNICNCVKNNTPLEDTIKINNLEDVYDKIPSPAIECCPGGKYNARLLNRFALFNLKFIKLDQIKYYKSQRYYKAENLGSSVTAGSDSSVTAGSDSSVTAGSDSSVTAGSDSLANPPL